MLEQSLGVGHDLQDAVCCFEVAVEAGSQGDQLVLGRDEG